MPYKIEILPKAEKQYQKLALKVPLAEQEELWRQILEELQHPLPEKQRPEIKKKIKGKQNIYGFIRLKAQTKSLNLRLLYLIDEETDPATITVYHIAKRKDLDYDKVVKVLNKQIF